MDKGELINKNTIGLSDKDIKDYYLLKEKYSKYFSGSKSFKAVWQELFGDVETVNKITAIPKFRALMTVVSNYASFGSPDYKIENKIDKSLKKEVKDLTVNHLLATTLAEWLFDDNTKLIHKNSFLALPTQFKQFKPLNYSDEKFIIGHEAKTYNFKLTADAMYTIMNTPGFVNTYYDVDSLRPCEYAIRKTKGNYAFVINYFHDGRLKKYAVATSDNDEIDRHKYIEYIIDEKSSSIDPEEIIGKLLYKIEKETKCRFKLLI